MSKTLGLAVLCPLFSVACFEDKPPVPQRTNLEITGSSECLGKAISTSWDYARDWSAPEWGRNHIGKFEAAEIKISEIREMTDKLHALQCDLKIKRLPCRPVASDVNYCSSPEG